VGPRTGLDTAVEKRKIPQPPPGIEPPNPDYPAGSQSAKHEAEVGKMRNEQKIWAEKLRSIRI
jgi:hypothetical protein